MSTPKSAAYSAMSTKTTEVDATVIRKFRNANGMGWIVTGLFIIGECAGGGLIAMPTAMVGTGIGFGTFLNISVALLCTYTAWQLAENWTILQERWPEYRHFCRKPYPAIAHRALGPLFKTIVSICLNITMFGSAVVFMLIASKNIESMLNAYAHFHIGFCYLVVIVGICMLPLTLLKSPQDFWWAIIGAMITTSISVVLIVINASMDYATCSSHNKYPTMDLNRSFMAFGTIMFAYGGHGAFPTIQHDMREPYLFQRSAFLAFSIICIMYLWVAFMGYFAYGSSLQSSVLPSLQNVYIQQIVNLLISAHVILALTIVMNPLNQELEEFLNVPQDFGVKRIVVRTAVMLAAISVAISVPEFGVLLDLAGGSTMTLIALVFPVLFNLLLNANHRKYAGKLASNDERITISDVFKYNSMVRLIINMLVLAFALIGGIAATWTALQAMLSSEFSPPCYAGLFSGESTVHNNEALTKLSSYGKFICCGEFNNISRYGSDQCLDPKLFLNIGPH